MKARNISFIQALTDLSLASLTSKRRAVFYFDLFKKIYEFDAEMQKCVGGV